MTTLYRATNRRSDAKSIPVDTCWTDDRRVAEAYQDNPGFGGRHIVVIEAELGECADWTDEAGGTRQMIRDLMGDSDEAYEMIGIWGGYQPFQALENSPRLTRIVRKNYDWIKYSDDYPEGATAYRRMR
jgi:hypothetical protein